MCSCKMGYLELRDALGAIIADGRPVKIAKALRLRDGS